MTGKLSLEEVLLCQIPSYRLCTFLCVIGGALRSMIHYVCPFYQKKSDCFLAKIIMTRTKVKRPKKIRRKSRRAIRKQSREQERMGMKLSSLRRILHKVHNNQMHPDVAYNTIVNAILDKDYKAKNMTLMEFFLSLFQK